MKKYVILGIVIFVLLGLGVALFIVRSDSTSKSSTTKPKQNYVALGDSVAAGIGLPTTSDSSACGRTNESYPYQLASLRGDTLKNIACSGATFPEGIIGTQTVNQLALPSQINQMFSLPRPDIITLTAGANDIHWSDTITKCYTGVCGTAAQTASIDAELVTVGANLASALTQIQNYYKSSPPKVLVTGYYQVFPASTLGCVDLLGISSDELAWGRAQQSKLNDTLKATASKFSFAVYAPIDFSGHELCTSTSWVQGLADTAPFHPTAAGQTTIAQQIAKLLTQ